MTRIIKTLGSLLLVLATFTCANATYNAVTVGNVGIVQQMGTNLSYTPGTLIFSLDNAAASPAVV